MLRFLIILCSVVILTSCAHAPVVEKDGLAAKTAESMKATVTGVFLDADVLAQGGDIAIVPFKAGPQAEANDELDRLSLMIVKGVTESLNAQKKSLHVVDATEGKPKLAMQGYIEEYSKMRKFSQRMMMRPDQASLKLSGEVWLISNGQRLLSFATEKKFNPKKEKPMNVAYSLGKDIGDYIGSYTK